MTTQRNIDYTSRDYEGFRNDMIELLKQKIPEYSDFSESDMGIVLIELLAHGLDILSYYNDKVANEIFPDTATERESIIKHCRRLGYTLKNSIPSQYYQVFKIIPQTSDYVIPRGFKLRTSGEENIEFELLEDLVIPKNCTGLEKDEHNNYLYKVLVEHGSTVNSDIVGTSNGTAYQEFLLSNTPIIVDSLKVFVRNEFDIEEWERVDNFIDSDTTSKQYMIEVTENDQVKIMFGSGISGAIPPRYEDGISASYRIGGGDIGNVSLESITEMSSKPAIIIDTMNVEQVQVGKEKETIEEAKIHAPLSLRTLWRAVTLQDYEDLLLQEYPGEILRAKAIAEEDRYTISLYVLTDNETEDLPEANKSKYLEFLDSRKEIGYNLQMFAPTYETVNLTIDVVTNKAYKNNEVKELVTLYLNSTFTKDYFDFGDELLVSHLIKQLMILNGVYDVKVTPVGNTKPVSNKLVKLGTITVNVQGGV